MLGLFRKRTVASRLLSTDDLLSDSTPSLFILGQLSLPFDYDNRRRSWDRRDGRIAAIGFANSWLETPSDPTSRTHDFSSVMFISDRFLTIVVDEHVRRLARIRVSERRVDDGQLRADLNYTGFDIEVSVRDATFRLIQDHLDQPITEDEGDAMRDVSRGLALRIPTRPFALPPTRGNPDPWDTSKDAVGRLKTIRSFDIDSIVVTLMSRNPLTNVPALGSLYERYEPWLRSTRSLHCR